MGPSALEQYEYMENAGQARFTQLPNYVSCTSPPQRGSEVYQSQEDGVVSPRCCWWPVKEIHNHAGTAGRA